MLCFYFMKKFCFITTAYRIVREQYPKMKFGFHSIEYHGDYMADVYFVAPGVTLKIQIEKTVYNNPDFVYVITRI